MRLKQWLYQPGNRIAKVAELWIGRIVSSCIVEKADNGGEVPDLYVHFL